MAIDVSRSPEYASTIVFIGVLPSPFDHLVKPRFDRGGLLDAAADEQNRVIAGHCARHFRQPGTIEQNREPPRLARIGPNEEQQLDALHAPKLGADRPPQLLTDDLTAPLRSRPG